VEKSHTLFDLERVMTANEGKAPATYRQFIKLVSSMKPPPTPVPHVSAKIKNCGITPISDDHDDLWSVPTLSELGFDTDHVPPPKWPGGETEALNRLDRHLERKAWVASFGKPKMTPQSLYASPAGLSPYLRFGCLSTRLFYHLLGDL
jgi:cryptochrome